MVTKYKGLIILLLIMIVAGCDKKDNILKVLLLDDNNIRNFYKEVKKNGFRQSPDYIPAGIYEGYLGEKLFFLESKINIDHYYNPSDNDYIERYKLFRYDKDIGIDDQYLLTEILPYLTLQFGEPQKILSQNMVDDGLQKYFEDFQYLYLWEMNDRSIHCAMNYDSNTNKYEKIIVQYKLNE